MVWSLRDSEVNGKLLNVYNWWENQQQPKERVIGSRVLQMIFKLSTLCICLKWLSSYGLEPSSKTSILIRSHNQTNQSKPCFFFNLNASTVYDVTVVPCKLCRELRPVCMMAQNLVYYKRTESLLVLPTALSYTGVLSPCLCFQCLTVLEPQCVYEASHSFL